MCQSSEKGRIFKMFSETNIKSTYIQYLSNKQFYKYIAEYINKFNTK